MAMIGHGRGPRSGCCSGDLRLAETMHGRRCRIIWFNFAGTLAVDTVGMGLAAFGLLNPLLAAFIHVTSELAFILNSARCCRWSVRLDRG
ncbi:MAG: hypothetical protein U0736_04200 [Gemmataceae bacterium]